LIPYKALEDPTYRHEYLNAHTDGTLATQLRLLREQNEMTQKDLAGRAGMKQSRISALENVNYSSWSIRTLRRLARVFDVAVVVRFERFGKVLHELDEMSPGTLAPVAYERDPVRDEPNQTARRIDVTSAVGLIISTGPATSDHTKLHWRLNKTPRLRNAHISVAPPSNRTTADS
jgi:transcriptional regulator with XRE-family HTH domain